MKRDKKLSLKQLDIVLMEIKKYRRKQEKLNKLFNEIGTGNLLIDCGGNLLDVLINLLEISFNDTDNVIEWFIFENDFGENKLTKTINNKRINLRSTKELFNYLNTK